MRLHRTGGYVSVALGGVISVAGFLGAGPALGVAVGTAALLSVGILTVAYRKESRA